MRAACLSLSAHSPARRPLRLALSALSPPSLSSATHLFTARRLALNTCAAWDLLHPSTHGVYRLPPQQLLRRGFELPGIISVVHTSSNASRTIWCTDQYLP